MIEQKIEKIMVERLAKIVGKYGVGVYGTLQPSFLKASEGIDTGVLVVKVSPREYDTPMVPSCRLNCTLSLSLRADLDFSGKNYLEITEMLIEELEKFQKCLEDVHQIYCLPNEFEPTGFLLGSGETSIDRGSKTWIYAHTMTIYGIVNDRAW